MVRDRAKTAIAVVSALIMLAAVGAHTRVFAVEGGVVPAPVSDEAADTAVSGNDTVPAGEAERAEDARPARHDGGISEAPVHAPSAQRVQGSDGASALPASVPDSPYAASVPVMPAPAVSAHRDAAEERTGHRGAEGFAFSVSSGSFIPVSRYASRYDSSLSFGLAGVLPVYSFNGFYPAAGLSYTAIRTKSDPQYVSSRMALFTGSVGARRSFRFESPALLNEHTFLTRGWHLDAGVYAGMTRVSFTSEIRHSPVIDYVGTLGLSCGAYLTLLEHLDAGVSGSAQRVFTAGVPLDSIGVTLCVSGSW